MCVLILGIFGCWVCWVVVGIFSCVVTVFFRRNEQNSAIVFGAFFVVVVSSLLFCSSCVSGGAHSVCEGSLVLAKVLAWCCEFFITLNFLCLHFFLPF